MDKKITDFGSKQKSVNLIWQNPSFLISALSLPAGSMVGLPAIIVAGSFG